MARKTVFEAEDVVAAAQGVLEADGLAAVTARRVADALGASTAPVYSNFASMDDLIAAVMRRASRQIVAFCRRPWTEDPFLSMGVGFVHFAHEHPQLFRALYLDSAGGASTEDLVFAALLADLAAHPVLGRLPADHREELLFQASIYTMGIATSLVTRAWPDPDLDLAESWLRSVGGLLVRAALESAGQPLPPEMARSVGEFVVPWRPPGCPATKDGPHD
jgi:AcrR family transcriptional regulator